MAAPERPLRVAVVGAAGRMGRMLLRAVLDDDASSLVVATERDGSPYLGGDAGALVGFGDCGTVVTTGLPDDSGCDVIIDFTAPQATLAHAEFAAAHGCAMVIGTTGFSDGELASLRQRLSEQRAVMAANFSVGVNLALQLARQTAAILDETYDAEIVEAHHRHKVDAPSGTALALGRAVAEGRGVDLRQRAVFAREGETGARRAGDIGFAVVRAGNIVGDHRTLFVSDEEQVEIRHVAHDRMVFAKGALRAAHWLAAQPAGWYDMADVLGFGDD